MSEKISLMKKLLGSVFGHVDGDLSLLAGDRVHAIDSAEEAVRILDTNSGLIEFDLRTTEAIAGLVAVHADKKAAGEMADRLAPSFAVLNDDTGAIRLVYLLSAERAEIESFLEAECSAHETDSFYMSDTLPVPRDPFYLDDPDMDDLEAGVEFPVRTMDDMKVLFPKAKKKAPAKKTLSDVVTKLNDAEVYGEISEEILSTQIQIASGENAEAKIWKTSPKADFRYFLNNQLSTHRVGKKDGECFVTGALADKRRVRMAVTNLTMMGLDVDSGASMEQTFQRIREMGLFAVLYTTHSQGKNTIEIKQDAFFKFMTKEHPNDEPEASTENVQKFLTHQDKYNADVIASAVYVDTNHTEKGLIIAVQTKPFDRFRIIFLLETPYVIAEQRMSQGDAVKHWSKMVTGMGQALGISVDRSAVDPSRLFYYPRHAKGATNYRILVNGDGDRLDWRTIKLGDGKQVSSDPFEQAANIMGARSRGRVVTPETGMDLMTWAAERGDGFLISKVFQDHCPDRMRDEIGNGKYTIECPFDDEHSNPGDPEDKGCYIEDAGMTADQFQFRCRHDSCQSYDRLQMLSKCMTDGWFSEEVIVDDDYDMMDRTHGEGKADAAEGDDAGDGEAEKEKEKVNSAARFRDAIKKADKLTQQSPQKDIDDIIDMCVDMHQAESSRIVAMMASKLKVAKTAIESMLKSARARSTAGQTIDDQRYDAAKASAQAKARFASLKKSKKPVVVVDTANEVPTINHLINTLNDINVGRAEIVTQTRDGAEIIPEIAAHYLMLQMGDVPVRAVLDASGSYKPDPLTDKLVASLASEYLECIELVDGSYHEVVLPKSICDMVVASPKMKRPQLEGFSTLPYYRKDHVLVVKNGFDPLSGKILELADWQRELIFGNSTKAGLIKLDPTIEDVKAAWAELFEFTFADFPFYDGESLPGGHSSRAHFLCMILHQLVRALISGPTPLYMVDKPAAGTGASLLCGSGFMISTGKAVGTMAMPEHDDEVRKGITSALTNGKSIVFYDNVLRKLESAFYANLATSEVWEDRLLGSSTLTTVKNTVQCVFAGNNIDATDENMRRMLPIRLDFKDDPTMVERKFHVENLEKFVKENQTDLWCHLVTFVQFWIKKGMPLWQGRPLTGFEGYCRVMGGILEACEIPGFLGNRHLYQSSANTDKLAWAGFLQEIISKKGLSKPLSIAELATIYTQMPDQPTLVINGGFKVNPTEDESRVIGPMTRVMEKQVDQVFRIYYKGEEDVKATIKKTVNRERGLNLYSIALIEADKAEAA